MNLEQHRPQQFPLSDNTGASALPPVWVDTAEEVEDMLVQVNQ